MKTCEHCGKPVHKIRSGPDHRRFFAVIRAAFNHWPEYHEFQPDDETHLRAWLTAKAGYRETQFIPMEDNAPPMVAKLAALAAEAAIKAAKGHSFVVVTRNGLGIVSAKSIAWDKLSQKEFGPLRDAVEAVIEAEIGVSADALLRETENAA